ncbi:hypothetical protein AURDEDRAFT_176178 [Auricularia subglabra TFB-10046 SS5]|uniref:MYND-type domain-containing protein n=1 Tax=Auricularia subglabra (strain TFB-10046 / SS5) TaxID=717982 RepID=J0WRW1_AURST|nr:hypothetical protein AURDEDRAFT_176178 [Auricularia subglabra TFB-10046 SS5]
MSSPHRGEVGCPEVPTYAIGMQEEQDATMRDPYRALQHYLLLQAGRGACQGPECVHDKGSIPGAFLYCGKCRAVQYCSTECQRADWSNTTHPHRVICNMLAKLFSFARMEMGEAEFADACRDHAFALERVHEIIEWAANGQVANDSAHREISEIIDAVPIASNRSTPVTEEETREGIAEVLPQTEAGTHDRDISEMQSM